MRQHFRQNIIFFTILFGYYFFFLIRIFAFRILLLSNLYRDIYYSLSLCMDIILIYIYIHYTLTHSHTSATHTCKRNNSVFSFVPHCYCKHIAPSCHPRRKKEQSLKSPPNARVYLFCVKYGSDLFRLTPSILLLFLNDNKK